jgi:superfamily II DNA or RNA helicase
MRAIIVDNQWIHFDTISTHEEDILWREFSVADKKARFIDTITAWDGIYRFYNKSRRKLARPFLAMLKSVCDKHALPLEVIDAREEPKYTPIDKDTIDNKFLPDITLDDHQVDWLKLTTSSECGLCKAPTGSGKGELIAGTCKVIQCPTVILADQTIVVEQLKKRIELRDIIDTVGMFYAGSRPNGETIVVGTIQSLVPPRFKPKKPIRDESDDDSDFKKKLDRHQKSLVAYATRIENSKKLLKYIKNADMLIVDEADKAVSGQWKEIFKNHFKGRRRYGFSGTPYDPAKPIQNMQVTAHLGSVIHEESVSNLQNIGRIIPIEYYMMSIGENGSKDDRTVYDMAIDDFIVNNNEFHKKILNICKIYSTDSTMILVERETLGLILVEKLAQIGIEAHYIYGKTPKPKRREVLKNFEDKKFKVLVGGKIVNRGLDLKGGCDNLIIATGGKLQSTFIQQIGRAVRINTKGKSKVFDFLFLCNRYLYDHARNRLKIIVDSGYKSTILFKNGSIDGADFIRRRFRIPTFK